MVAPAQHLVGDGAHRPDVQGALGVGEVADDAGELLDLLGGQNCASSPTTWSTGRSACRRETSRHRSVSSATSSAGRARPIRLEVTASPARSKRVNSSPHRPCTRWSWSTCRARVDFPQSIVPEESTSSATGDRPAAPARARAAPGSADGGADGRGDEEVAGARAAW